ncbi:phosphatases II [Ascobolus immersus RN42]|uniref:Phosphatases II n=1 Tax=Ascobolus immersus RN42 TaxID=1160509 RepID=A0A3N4IN19_ASCIM|nr:phosphatases II [Ascobolus immersus RN42]
MEYIKVPKVNNVHLLTKGIPRPGSLHITPHHLIFRHEVPKPSPSERPISSPSRSSSSNSTTTQSKPLPSPQSEIWITYPIISQATRSSTNSSGYSSLRIRCRDFTFITFHFFVDKDCKDVFESIKALSCKTSLERLYAFFYKPPPQEAKYNGWELYDAKREYERMGVGTTTKAWRFSNINADYSFCPSYPSILVVPTSISDNTLKYVSKYRSRERIPALTYLHSLNNCTITRSSQPLVGVRGNRSVQDEKLVAAIFSSSDPRNMLESYEKENGSDERLASELDCITSSQTETKKIYGAQQSNLIIDARPTMNAYAMQAAGAGSENMDNYRMGGSCTKQYLGIDNIHVMRDSLLKVVEAIKDSDVTPLPPNRELLRKSGWLGHVTTLIEGVAIIVKQVAIQHSHVLIHCSDGWDRTSQLSALAQLCLDPYYRTLEGFMILVEKDWLSFGHRFRDRSGIGSSEKSFVEKIINLPREDNGEEPEDTGLSGFHEGVQNAFSQAKLFFGRKAQSEPEPEFEGSFLPDGTRKTPNPPPPSVVNMKETSPTFHHFLDATYQLLNQYPTRFEFNERFLRRLLYHVYSCQYGTFLYNCERERLAANIAGRTRSVWDYFLSRKHLFTNPHYATADDLKEKGSWSVIVPKSTDVRWWWELWGRTDQEMNGTPEREVRESSVTTPAEVETTSSDKDSTATPPLAAPAQGQIAKQASASSGQEPLSHQHAANSLNTPPALERATATKAENDPVNTALDAVQGGLQGLKLGVEGLMRAGSTRNSSPARKAKEQIEVEMM